jgi:membrane protein DedA with SNARE-associated domain
MTMTGVILAGTFGSWLGSTITYLVARWVGRPVVLRWGKYFFCPPEKLARAERFLERYEAGAIFFARLLPVVRHLISIPAGIVRMPFGKFSLMTTIGAGIWCAILAWLGVKVAERNPRLLDNPDALVHAIKGEVWWIVGAVVLLGALYFLMLRLTTSRHATEPVGDS